MRVCVSVCVSTSQFDLPNPSSEHNAITALEKRPVSVWLYFFFQVSTLLPVHYDVDAVLLQVLFKTEVSQNYSVGPLFHQQDRTQSVCLLVPKGDPDVRGMGTRNALDAPPRTSVPVHPVYTQTRQRPLFTFHFVFKETVM